jgi:hypothetical protein
MHNEIARLLITDEGDLQAVLDKIAEDHSAMGMQVPGTEVS